MTQRVAILGASGLIGHKLYERLRERFDVYPVLHNEAAADNASLRFEPSLQVDVRQIDAVTALLETTRADVVLNCAGITKRKPEIADMTQAIEVNALFPHKLAELVDRLGARMIHFSTDCVFDGAAGPYTEASPTTAKDTYGRTKALGEVTGSPAALTIRSSFIGRELSGRTELLEWFLAQRGKTIKGFSHVLYSGISTIEMARVIGDIIEFHSTLSGLYQLAMPEPISKYELLCHARDAFDVDVAIEEDSSVVSSPTLDGSRLQRAIDVRLPDWPQMMHDLAAETIYDALT